MNDVRPQMAVEGDGATDARAAVDRLVAELQDGLDRADSAVYNRHFAGDVLWGGPYGTTVTGYERLHDIHTRLLAEGRAGRSRYLVENVVAPVPGIAVAHVRRAALAENGLELAPDVGFSEMALYVFAERDGEWWLVAGQNTPIREHESADRP